jgi:hypothetical protein
MVQQPLQGVTVARLFQHQRVQNHFGGFEGLPGHVLLLSHGVRDAAPSSVGRRRRKRLGPTCAILEFFSASLTID